MIAMGIGATFDAERGGMATSLELRERVGVGDDDRLLPPLRELQEFDQSPHRYAGGSNRKAHARQNKKTVHNCLAV